MALLLPCLAWAAEGIRPAPAFTAEVLSRPQADGWYTSGGTLDNQRYSPLQQINRQNVGGMKALWHVSLGSGTALRHNNQAQPLVHDGVIYIATGQNDVFAISVDTGQVLWEYRSGLKDGEAFVCCQWANRGVGLGDGKVFLGRVDAVLLALDQRTGKVLWQTRTGDPKRGYSLTAAPLYYDGKVIIGSAGGDLGIRGWVKAFDADTGREVWTFHTIPGPGEFGHDTWPQDNDVWQWGGGAVWSTPAIDPELGLVYFSTGNPGPSLGGAVRRGDNLFTASIVAVDVQTGRYRWHFQEVHHDIWDYDAPNPIILFDAPYDGVMRKGLAQAGKTGWVYLLDRVTGKPLLGIHETPVAQEPRAATSPTQPIPVGDALVEQFIPVAPEDHPVFNRGRVFTPFAEQARIYTPLAAVNWPPSAYDPRTQWMYICANESGNGARMDNTQYAPPTFRESFRGGAYVGAGMPSSGVYSALDVKTNRLVWQRRFNDGCRSGSLVTGGGLVFLGRNDGRVIALDAADGTRLWQFQTEAPVNSAVSTFMHKGQQLLVTYAGGGFLSAQKGDGVWLFGLQGKLGEREPLRTGGQQAMPPLPPPARTADLRSGEQIYKAACLYCHGERGQGGEGGGKAISPDLGPAVLMQVLRNGRNQMPAFGATLTAEQLQDLAAYVEQLPRSGAAPQPAAAFDRGRSLQAWQDPGYAAFTARCKVPPQPRRIGGGAAAAQDAEPPAPLLPAPAAIPGVLAPGQQWRVVWRWQGNNADGPIAGPDGSLLFANNDASNVMRLDPDTGLASVLFDRTNTGGALSRSRSGALFLALRGLGGGIEQLEPQRRRFASTYQGEPIECVGGTPNDLVADARGGVYLSVSGSGVYYANPAGELTKYGDVPAANGIMLSPDERTLYATNGAVVVAFDVQPDGALANQREFGRLRGGQNGDGAAVDAEGRLYVTTGASVDVFSPDGGFLGSIAGPRGLHGVAFGGRDRQTLFGIVFYGAWGTPAARNQIVALPLLARGLADRAK